MVPGDESDAEQQEQQQVYHDEEEVTLDLS